MQSLPTSSYRAILSESTSRIYAKSIAGTLLDGLNKIRGDTKVEVIRRRWIWELIQNAKDVAPQGGVSIRLECDLKGDNPHVTFIHNGIPFTIDDIRFLIEQVSTKTRAKDENGKSRKTGRFGTGFLTTHLLSEIVRVGGVVKEPVLNHKRFQLALDRRGTDLEEIATAVQTAKDALDSIDASPDRKRHSERASRERN